MTRAAEGSLRDALSILDQALAYCGSKIAAAQVRELLGVVEAELLEQFVAAISGQSSEKMLRLVDTLVRDGHNLQFFCREALRHVRNLLVVRIGGPAAELAEAAGEERRQLEAAARQFSEEDLLRFFTVLLRTEGELRWSPHPRLHLELGLLKLVEAERLVPLEEVLAELTGNPVAGAPRPGAPAAPVDAPARREAAPAAKPQLEPPAVPASIPASNVEATTIEAIKNAVFGQSKFLGSFVESVSRWERQPDSLTLWFTPENRSLSEMLGKQQKTELEKIVSQVLGEPVKINPRVAPPGGAARPAGAEKSAVVQALLDRFGGTLRTGAELAPRRGPKSES
jgi:DNA polymerase-3 subunit gamma/tau